MSFEDDGIVDDAGDASDGAGITGDGAETGDWAETGAAAHSGASDGPDSGGASGDGDGLETGDGDGDGDGDGSGLDTGDGDADADMGCAGVTRCQAIPDGWEGWIAMVDAEYTAASQACGALGDAYPSFLAGFHTGVGVINDGCKCSCNAASTAAQMCNVPEATVRLYEQGSDCQDPNTSVFVGPLTTGGCVGPFLYPDGVTEVVGGTDPIAAQTSWDCQAIAEGTYTFDTPGGLCVADLDVVSGGACVTEENQAGACISPPPDDPSFGDGVCIWRPGSHLCPDAYPVTHDGFTEVDDTRECTGCGCEASVDGVCDVRVEVFSGDACFTGVGTTNSHADACMPINYNSGTPPTTPVHKLTYQVVPQGLMTAPSCTDMGVATPTPGGEVTGAGAITVCCDQ